MKRKQPTSSKRGIASGKLKGKKFYPPKSTAKSNSISGIPEKWLFAWN